MAARASRVLVLGGLGFIGSNLSRLLAAEGREVTAVTRKMSRHADTAAALGAAGVRTIEADLGDAAAMASAVRGQDVIINLAGVSGAVHSMEQPLDDLEGNCRANLVLLEAIRAHNPGVKFVFVGSRLQYGRPVTLPVREDHPLAALSVHAVHKNAIEQYLRVYEHAYGLRYTVARVTNPYGPGQPTSTLNYGVVNRLIHLALTDQVLPIYGEGEQQRDYIYVDDAAAALIQLADDDRSNGQAFNVASGTGTALIDMAEAIVKAAGSGRIQRVPWPDLAKQIETGDFYADISRIAGTIGWRPATSLRDGIDRTVAFHRAHSIS